MSRGLVPTGDNGLDFDLAASSKHHQCLHWSYPCFVYCLGGQNTATLYSYIYNYISHTHIYSIFLSDNGEKTTVQIFPAASGLNPKQICLECPNENVFPGDTSKGQASTIVFKDNVFHLIFQGVLGGFFSGFDGGFVISGLRREKELAFRWEFFLALKPIEMETGTGTGEGGKADLWDNSEMTFMQGR